MTLKLLTLAVLLYDPLHLRVELSHLVLEILAGTYRSLSSANANNSWCSQRSPNQAMTTHKIEVV